MNDSPYIISKSVSEDMINACREDLNNRLTTEQEHLCLMQDKKQRIEFQTLFQDIQFLGHSLNPDRYDLREWTAHTP